MAALYLDHDISALVARLLSAAGHDVLATRAIGQERAGDHQQLLFSARQGRVLLSHNWRDYRLLHAAWQLWSTAWGSPAQHGGILILDHGDPAVLAEQVEAFIGGSAQARNRLYRFHAGSWREYA